MAQIETHPTFTSDEIYLLTDGEQVSAVRQALATAHPRARVTVVYVAEYRPCGYHKLGDWSSFEARRRSNIIERCQHWWASAPRGWSLEVVNDAAIDEGTLNRMRRGQVVPMGRSRAIAQLEKCLNPHPRKASFWNHHLWARLHPLMQVAGR